jgi:hypothetical protein
LKPFTTNLANSVSSIESPERSHQFSEMRPILTRSTRAQQFRAQHPYIIRIMLTNVGTSNSVAAEQRSSGATKGDQQQQHSGAANVAATATAQLP